MLEAVFVFLNTTCWNRILEIMEWGGRLNGENGSKCIVTTSVYYLTMT